MKHKIIEDHFYSFLQIYKKHIEESMIVSELDFNCVDSLYHELHKIRLTRGGTCVDSHKWLKKKGSSKFKNKKRTDDKCFQYASFSGIKSWTNEKSPRVNIKR